MRASSLIVLFLFVYLEASLFIWVAGHLGVGLSLLALVATSLLGMSLIKRQGMKTLSQAMLKLTKGESPAQNIVKSVSYLFAGILLVIPGFFTDLLALLLLLPPVQKILTWRLMPFVKIYQPAASAFGYQQSYQQQDSTVIDGEFQVKEDDPAKQIHRD